MNAPVEMYRLRIVRGNGGSSSGKVEHFENRERFELEVLEALIEAFADGRSHGTAHQKWRAAYGWRKKVIDRRKGDDRLRCIRFMAAEQLVNGEWVDLKPELLLPSILWGQS